MKALLHRLLERLGHELEPGHDPRFGFYVRCTHRGCPYRVWGPPAEHSIRRVAVDAYATSEGSP